jgi:methylenetetrahydrofolate reductase (NADPH)
MSVPSVSFEFFPPKTEDGNRTLFDAASRLGSLRPEFVSVTYGAGGSTREPTAKAVTQMREKLGFDVAPHLTCVDASKEETLEIVRDYLNQGITKLVALRGDPRDGVEGVYTPPANGFAYASDLIAGLRDFEGLDLFVSAYPEVHPQAPSADFDIEVLKNKQDNGASAAITQFFFNNDDFFRYRDHAATAGVTMPIIPGIMVPENIKGVLRFAKACGASVPSSLSSRFAGIEDDEETRRLIATHFTIQQCEQLVAAGVKHFHLYTLNRAESAYAVCHALGLREPLVEAA